MNKKLDTKLDLKEIKQTRHKSVEASPIGSASPGSRNERPLLAFRIFKFSHYFFKRIDLWSIKTFVV